MRQARADLSSAEHGGDDQVAGSLGNALRVLQHLADAGDQEAESALGYSDAQIRFWFGEGGISSPTDDD